MRAPEPAGGGGMDNHIFLGTIAQRGKFIGRHDAVRKSDIAEARCSQRGFLFDFTSGKIKA